MEFFECPKMPKTMRMKLTEVACGRYYKQSHKEVTQPVRMISGIYQYCRNCNIGKTNAKKFGNSPKIKKRSKKICYTYQTSPDHCLSKEGSGKFYRQPYHTNANWNQKIFCSKKCGLNYHNMRIGGIIK